jgi:hypothetical protein
MLGNMHGDCFTEDFDRQMKGSGNNASLFNGGPVMGTCRVVHLSCTLEMIKGPVYCGPSKICKERLWNQEPVRLG